MRFRLVLLLSLVCLAGSAQAWKGGLATGVIPIEAVRKNAEKGDRVTIQGRVEMVEEDRFFRLRDDTGTMIVRIPESVRRRDGQPEMQNNLICWGRYAHAYLEKDIWGVHCQKLEIVKP